MILLGSMSPASVAMLAGGIALFVVALALLVFYAVKGQSFKPLLPVFAVAIIMIGFPSITQLKAPGLEIDTTPDPTATLATKSAAEFAQRPNDPKAIASYRAALRALDDSRATNPHAALSPQVRSNLLATAGLAARFPRLSPQSYVAVSHAQLILGETNQARETLAAALKADTNLIQSLDSRLKSLAEPVSQ
jgi:hypothetical protein